MMYKHTQLRDLIDRLSRLHLSEGWTEDLNPTQRDAVIYLARANRFSRSPSHVATYLCTTRGTASQTLKALVRKGLVRVVRSETDRRSISYELTSAGEQKADVTTRLDEAVNALPDSDADALSIGLSEIIRETLARREGQSFGMCRTCRHHEPQSSGGFCMLLNVELGATEVLQLCHEHLPADAA